MKILVPYSVSIPVLLALTSPVFADTLLGDPSEFVGPTVLVDFETFPNGDTVPYISQDLDDQWLSLGFRISDDTPENGASAYSGTFGVPPHSGIKALADSGGSIPGLFIEFHFEPDLAFEAGIWVQNGNTGSLVEFFGPDGSLLASMNTTGQDEFVGLRCVTGIASVRINDDGFYMVDDLEFNLTPPAECFFVVGDAPGNSTLLEIDHLFETQVGPAIEDDYAVLLDDIPEFVLPQLPMTERIHSSSPGGPDLGTAWLARGAPVGGECPTWMLDGQFAVQVLMWNPQVFPGLPEQYTAGLFVTILPNGTVLTEPYGTDVGGLQIWHEIDTNAAGQKVIRFPFSIPGM